MRIRHHERADKIELSMTPMIDIVFLLIAFFMIVSDLSKLNIKPVILPLASEARVPKPKAGDRVVIINVMLKNRATGEYTLHYMSGEACKLDDLKSKLAAEVLNFDKWEDNPNVPGQKDSLLTVNIRCDEGANSKAVQEIYYACQANKIYRVISGALSKRSGHPWAKPAPE